MSGRTEAQIARIVPDAAVSRQSPIAARTWSSSTTTTSTRSERAATSPGSRSRRRQLDERVSRLGRRVVDGDLAPAGEQEAADLAAHATGAEQTDPDRLTLAQWFDHNTHPRVTLLLDNADVRQVLSMRSAIDALADAFRDLADGRAVNRPRSHTYTDLGEGRHYLFKSMDGALPGQGVHGLRLSSDLTWEHDGRRDKIPAAPGDTYVGLVLLFDLETLEPLAFLHDGELQRVRVGATSALAADRLARPTRASPE